MLRLMRFAAGLGLVAVATSLALAACSSFSSDGAGNGGDDGGPDGVTPVIDGSPADQDTQDAADAGPCDLTKNFGNVTEVPGISSGDAGDYAAWLTPDERTIYFSTLRENGVVRIYRGTRTDLASTFGTIGPAPLANNVTIEEHPTLAPDESWMFLTRGTYPTRQIWYAPKTAGQFVPTLASGPANSAYDDIEPFFATATGDLLFSTSRDGPYNIYRAEVTTADGGTGPGSSALDPINLAGQSTFSPVLSADGLTIYVGSDRDVGANKSVIYAAKRADKNAAFSTPAQVTSIAAATPFDDRPNWVSPDHCRLYFTSTRSGVGRIYVASRP